MQSSTQALWIVVTPLVGDRPLGGCAIDGQYETLPSWGGEKMKCGADDRAEGAMGARGGVWRQ